MEKEFYVYEWIRLDTNEPFYVGKGCGHRAYDLKRARNRHFNFIVNKVGLKNCVVVILHKNLTEDEAFQYECWYIHEYKYEFCFNLANDTDGGEGLAGHQHTKEAKEKIGNKNRGRKYSEESKRIMKEHHAKPRSIPIVVFKNGQFYKEYSACFEFAKELGSVAPNDMTSKAIRLRFKGQEFPVNGKWNFLNEYSITAK